VCWVFRKVVAWTPKCTGHFPPPRLQILISNPVIGIIC
jgi:hypothetical protein